jgi:hypothetical protein
VADRTNHYEAAFEEFLRAREIPYIAVDEGRRALLAGKSLKSLDFILSPADARGWLVDIKGRKFPSGDQKQYWKNWSTRDDLTGMTAWQNLFGERFGALLVFAYWVLGDRSPVPREELFSFRSREYAFVAVRLADYAGDARPISPRWDTLAMPSGRFRSLAAPIDAFLNGTSWPENSLSHGVLAPSARLSTAG